MDRKPFTGEEVGRLLSAAPTEEWRGLILVCELSNHTPSLFQTVDDTMASFDMNKQRRLDATIDKLRARYGCKVVYFGSVQDIRRHPL